MDGLTISAQMLDGRQRIVRCVVTRATRNLASTCILAQRWSPNRAPINADKRDGVRKPIWMALLAGAS
jgi:hypothetical protein